MIVNSYDYNARRPITVEVPDEPIVAFMRWVLETSKWRELPGEVVQEKLVKLRKDLLAAQKPVELE